jgi:hypothetical protein
MELIVGTMVRTKPCTTGLYEKGYPLFSLAEPKDTHVGKVQPAEIGFVTRIGYVYADVLFSSGLHGAINTDSLEIVG